LLLGTLALGIGLMTHTLSAKEATMTDQTEIEWHREQIAKNRTILEELEASNAVGGDVFPETQSEIEHLQAQIAQSELIVLASEKTESKE
jgi:hypothetical protein